LAPEAEIHSQGPRAPLSDWFSRAKFALPAVKNNAQVGPRYRLGVVSISVSNPAAAATKRERASVTPYGAVDQRSDFTAVAER